MAEAKTDAIGLLKADHRKVEDLFEQFRKARMQDGKAELAKLICMELTVHAMIEEEIFYPACKAAVSEDILQEAYVEHDGAKVLIAEIAAGSPDAEFYNAKIKVLSEMIKHHVQEEEKRSDGLFAQARDAGLNVDALGKQMADRKQNILSEIEKDGLPDPETRSFTDHNLIQGEPVEQAAAQ